jgi:hypothetical protein
MLWKLGKLIRTFADRLRWIVREDYEDEGASALLPLLAVAEVLDAAAAVVRRPTRPAVVAVWRPLLPPSTNSVESAALANEMDQLAMSPDAFGLNSDEADIHRRCATVRALTVAGKGRNIPVGVAMAVPRQEWAEAIVQASLARAGINIRRL